MWHWHLNDTATQEELWQSRCENIANSVISQGFASHRIDIDIYWDTHEEALIFAACHGGKVKAMDDTDWVAATAPEKLPPLLIRQQLVISQSEDVALLDELRQKYPKRIILSFPAERAFGTGDHATTSTCLRLLCDFSKQHKAKDWVLTDIGCGTGVLALAGVRLGAKHALSFDFDPNAVEIAARNIARNGGESAIELFQADVFEWSPSEAQKADLVLANLFSTVLQAAFPRIKNAMKNGASLIISGILREQAEETIAAAEAQGLILDKKVTRGKWSTALLHLPL